MAAPLRILQFGATGQLGRALLSRAPAAGVEITALSRMEADLADPGAAARAVAAHDADLAVIAAAYTAVDAAESEEALARRINAEAAGEIAQACAQRGLKLVYVSTDYVFSGEGGRAWREDDPVAPQNAYGRTKAAGEQAVLDASPKALVLRTSWVFSPWGRNFVRTMLRLGAEQDEVAVVSDQTGRPTSALDLADTILTLAPRLVAGDGPSGVLHFANDGATDWAGFARGVFAEAEARGMPGARVRDIATADYPTPARRPANSVLDTSRIEHDWGITPRPWRQALAEVMDIIARESA